MTDTPIQSAATPPAPRSEIIKAFIGDLARPFAIYSTSIAASIGIVRVAWVVENGNDGAIYLGAVTVLVGGIFGFKAWENVRAGKQASEVEIAKASGQPSQTL